MIHDILPQSVYWAIGLNQEMASVGPTERLTTSLTVEDHGTEFYLISDGDGHDLTLSLDARVAERLAHFILARRGKAAPPVSSNS